MCAFDTENKRDYYNGKDWMKIFCKDLKENTMEIINHEKKDVPPLTNKECESYLSQTNCYMC